MPGLTASIAESVSLAVQQALMARCEAMQHMCSDGTGSGQLYPKPCAGPALTATTRAVYQDMEAFPHYCTSALWRIMQTSTPPAQRFGAFVTHALQLGMKHPTEKTLRMIVATFLQLARWIRTSGVCLPRPKTSW